VSLPAKCIDCGVETMSGAGSARCPSCWDDKCGTPTPESKEASQPPQWPHDKEIYSAADDNCADYSLMLGDHNVTPMERDAYMTGFSRGVQWIRQHAALSKVKELESNAEARRSQHANVILLGRQVDALRAKLEKATAALEKAKADLDGEILSPWVDENGKDLEPWQVREIGHRISVDIACALLSGAEGEGDQNVR